MFWSSIQVYNLKVLWFYSTRIAFDTLIIPHDKRQKSRVPTLLQLKSIECKNQIIQKESSTKFRNNFMLSGVFFKDESSLTLKRVSFFIGQTWLNSRSLKMVPPSAAWMISLANFPPLLILDGSKSVKFCGKCFSWTLRSSFPRPFKGVKRYSGSDS